MTTLEKAKDMGYASLLGKLEETALKEYGLYNELLKDKVFHVNAVNEEPFVYCGLNNADVDGALLELLENSPEKVLSGIGIAGMLVGSSVCFLYLPVNELELTRKVRPLAEKYGVILVNDIINVRETENHLRLHIVTACDLADLAEGIYEPGVYVKTGEEPLKKVAADTPVSSLINTENAKAVYLGYQYYTPDEVSSLTAKDAVTGLIRVLTDKDCIVEETRKQLLKDRTASCGRCVFCREGLIQLEYMQKETTAARGKSGFLDLIREIGEPMADQTLCSVGQESAKIALSAISKFPGEYEAHIKKKKCPAGVCGAFVHIYIDPHTCTGCEECTDVCPADCIEGKSGYIHMIDEFDCTKCGKCIEVCEEEAILMTSGKLPKLPNRLIKVGKFKKH